MSATGFAIGRGQGAPTMMGRMRGVLALSVAGIALATLVATAPRVASAADAATFQAAYENAQASRKKAAAAGFEWRDVKKMLKQAKKLADKGEYEQAEQLAIEAKMQADLGVKQAESQAEAWRSAVLR